MNEYLSLLRKNREFRWLWLAALSSYMGDWFNLIASAELIENLTSTGGAISLLFLARFLPSFVLSPIAGVLADRFDRRKLLIASDVLRAIVVLGFLFVRMASDVWLLYGLTVLQFALSAMFIPAKSAVLANVVAEEDLVTANALDSTTWSVMLAVGSLLGGVVTGLLGSDAAFILDAGTFVLSAGFIAMIAMPKKVGDSAESKTGFLDFLDGLRYLRGLPFILALSLVKAGGSLAWGALNVLEVQYASDVFPIGDGGATTLGIIYAVTGLGTGIGPILLRNWLGDSPPRVGLGILISFVLLTVGIGIVAIAPTLVVLCVGTFVRTFGSGGLWVFSAASLQRFVADEVRGRVFAFEFATLTLTQSISILWAGVAQDQIGLTLRQTMGSSVLVGVVVTVGWTVIYWRWRSDNDDMSPLPTAA